MGSKPARVKDKEEVLKVEKMRRELNYLKIKKAPKLKIGKS